MADKKLNIKVSTTGATKSKQELGGLNGAISKMGKAVGIASAAYFGARGLISGFSSVIRLAGIQEKAEAKLNAVIKSTGGAAGLTANELKKMASQLQDVTTFGDETIIGAQSLLLTFTKIGEDVFPQATETILNMAVAMETDLKSATVQLGKALNDPITGISALSRVGVQLTDTQKEQIKSFTELGDIASAQKVILGELETQFGGLAKATALTMAGSLEQMTASIGDAGEALGELLSPMVISTAKAIKTLAEGVGNLIDRFKDFGKEVDAVLLDKTALAKQAMEEFKTSIKGLSEEELLNLGHVIEDGGKKLVRYTDASKTSNEKLEILEATILKLREQQAKLAPVLETTTDLRKNESGIIFELDSEYTKFTETQKINLANQVAEAGMVARLIQDYPELANKLGLVEAKSSVLGDQIKLAGELSSALQTTFDPDLGAGEAFKGFVIQLMSAMQGVILASKAVSETLTFTFTGPLGIGAAIAALVGLEAAKAGVRSIKFAETGFDGVVNQPTMFMTGEGGPERVSVTPLTPGMNQNGPQGITLNISGGLIDDSYVRNELIPALNKATSMGSGLA
jgi:hypothetical protein